MVGAAAVKEVEPPPAAIEDDELKTEVKIRLRKPVQAHGEIVKELTFRAPTGNDIMALGDQYPLLMDFQTGDTRWNPGPMGMAMALLAQVPPSTIKLMHGKDWSTCALAIMPFFLPDDPATRS
jgi:hypothetical protein